MSVSLDVFSKAMKCNDCHKKGYSIRHLHFSFGMPKFQLIVTANVLYTFVSFPKDF